MTLPQKNENTDIGIIKDKQTGNAESFPSIVQIVIIPVNCATPRNKNDVTKEGDSLS